MSEKPKTTRRIGRILSAAALFSLLFLLLGAVFSAAWFSALRRSGRLFSIRTGNYTDPAFFAWVYDFDGEESGDAFLKTGGRWRNVAEESGTRIAAVTEHSPAFFSTEKYEFESLHLGTVDNLITLDHDNYFYLRFAVTDPVRQGRRVRARFSLPATGFADFYDAEGERHDLVFSEQATGEPGELLAKYFADILRAEYAVSPVGYDMTGATDGSPAAEGLLALFGEENAAGYGALVRDADPADLLAEGQNEPYYVYLRFFPDLDTCLAATDAIGIYMPCEMIFHLTIELEFYDIHM